MDHCGPIPYFLLVYVAQGAGGTDEKTELAEHTVPQALLNTIKFLFSSALNCACTFKNQISSVFVFNINISKSQMWDLLIMHLIPSPAHSLKRL